MSENESRINYLKKLISEKNKALLSAPEGMLRCEKHRNTVRYFYRNNPTDKKGIYIKKEQIDFVKQLAQKEYDMKVLQAAQAELAYLESIKHPSVRAEEVYNHLSMYRKALVQPIYLPDQMFVETWVNTPYTKKPFSTDTLTLKTERKEQVRSKSEMIIANTLNQYGIPYRYECPLYLNGFGTIYPDFTVLNIRQRKECVWEHMGKMDDPKYVNDNLPRLNAYIRNGYFPGDRLLITFESSRILIDTDVVHEMIRKYLL